MGPSLRTVAQNALGRVKPAQVRFYFDSDILGLGKLVSGLRSDCTYPGDSGAIVHKRQRPPCSITSTAVDDTDWIPAVTAQGLVIVTRDSKIQRRHAELHAVSEHNARMVALVSEEARTVWNQLEVLMTQWRRIEALTEESGPFIYRASRSSLAAVPLPT